MRVRVSSWCSVMVAVALATVSVTANAAWTEPPQQPEVPPQPEPPPEQPPPQPETPPPPETPPQPEPPPQPETPPPPEPQQPIEAPVEGPAQPMAIEEPAPQGPANARTMRKAGTGLMASGGVLAAGGLGLTIAYTVVGTRHENVDAPVLADVERAADVARVGGILLASGIAVVAVGGFIFTRGKVDRESRPLARVRVAPAFGGLVLSGRF